MAVRDFDVPDEASRKGEITSSPLSKVEALSLIGGQEEAVAATGHCPDAVPAKQATSEQREERS